ncbi:MAG: 23S rRNA (guanosine(2251)-2'-O)-methyltransferase RlmB [bacterium]|nr:23S rRNA (guanosine(2251)-2'-O)-methyltransferase RlmB [bacterium]
MASAGIGDSLEGFHAVRAALDAGRVTHIRVENSRTRRNDYTQLVSDATAAGVPVQRVDSVRDAAVTAAPQGILARARPIPTVPIEKAVKASKPPAVLVLDHLEDPRNIGAIARTMVAAGWKTLVLPERRSAPLGPTAFKAAVGAFEHLVISEVKSTADALRRLRKMGIWLVGLDGDGERSLFRFDLLTEPVALVVGAEGKGMTHLAKDLVDISVHIPIHPDIESLNASVAASLALYEVSRMRGTKLGGPLA